MICYKCYKEIKEGERAVAVSFGKVYAMHSKLEVIGYNYHYHSECYRKINEE